MPFKSKKQKRTIDAAAHNPEFAKKIGIKTSDAKKMSAHGKGQTKFEEATDTVEKDAEGNVKSWKHEGDWTKSKNKEGRGKVTNLSDKARRKTEKLSKPEKEMAEAFEQAMEGSIRGGVWTSQPPDKGQKDVPPPQEVDGGILNKKQSKPVNAPRSVKKAEVAPADAGADTEVAEGKQTYGGKGEKKTKMEHDAEVKKKKEKEKFKKMAEALVQIGRLEQMIFEAKKSKGDGNLANNAKPYDKVTRGDVIAGRLGKDEEGGKKKTKKTTEGNDGNLANNAKPYDKVTRGDVVAGRLGKDEMGGKKKDKKVSEASKEKEPEGSYSKKRFETDSQRVARLAKEKRQAEKKKEADKQVSEGKSKCTCEEDGKSKCAVHGKKKDAYMESLFNKLQNQLNG